MMDEGTKSRRGGGARPAKEWPARTKNTVETRTLSE